VLRETKPRLLLLRRQRQSGTERGPLPHPKRGNSLGLEEMSEVVRERSQKKKRQGRLKGKESVLL